MAVKTHTRAGDLLCGHSEWSRKYSEKSHHCSGDICAFLDSDRVERNIHLLGNLINSPPAEKTVRAARNWLAAISARTSFDDSLRERIVSESKKCIKDFLDATRKKANLLQKHLQHTLLEKEDDSPYFFSRRMIEDLTLLSRSDTMSLGKVLGNGGAGCVRVLEIGPFTRAIKIPHGDSDRLGIVTEAKNLTSLPEHPYILGGGLLIQATGDHLGLVLEEASSSAEFLFKGIDAESGGKLHRFFDSMSNALAFLHAQGYVHHDFKPGNVLCFPDGRLALGDMEMLRKIGEPFVGGSIAYTPPEAFKGTKAAPEIDVFSFGVTLLLGITGKTLLPRMMPGDAVLYLMRLEEKDVSAFFALSAPTESSLRFVEVFGDKAYEYFPMIDAVRENFPFYDRLASVISSLKPEEAYECTQLIEEAMSEIHLDLDQALSPEDYAGLARKFPAESFVNEIIRISEISENPVTGGQIQRFLKVPRELGFELLTQISSTDARELSTRNVRSTLLDPEGFALHLARHCLRIDPENRPSMSDILHHPYISKTDGLLPWEALYTHSPIPTEKRSEKLDAPRAIPLRLEESVPIGPNPFARGAPPELTAAALMRARLRGAELLKRKEDTPDDARNPFAIGEPPELTAAALFRARVKAQEFSKAKEE